MNKTVIDLLSGKLLNQTLKAAAERPVPKKRVDALLEAAEHEPLPELMLKKNLAGFVRTERALFEEPERVQETILREMLEASRDTAFGREHHFEEIRSLEDFRERVPLTEWKDYKAYDERLMKGEGDILFPGKAVFFCRSTGTTSAYKYIPQCPREENARKAVSQARVLERILTASLSSILRSFVFFEREDCWPTEGGIPTGTASGRTMKINASRISKRLAYSPLLVEELEGDALYYTMMRCALVRDDVTAILGNNAWMTLRMTELVQERAEELIGDIRNGTNRYPLSDAIREKEKAALRPNPRRAEFLEKLHREGRLIPKYYWPELRVASYWLGSTMGINVDRVKPLLPEKTVFLDVGYGASEAKINIPISPDTAAGPLSIFTGFFEFIPEGGGQPLLAHELEDGGTYEIVLTTYGGLYRYRIKDLVRVEGFTGKTPNICFASKSIETANLTAEMLPGVFLLDSIRKAASAAGCGLKAAQVYPDPDKMSYHVCVETEKEVPDSRELRRMIEEELLTNNNYRFFLGRSLHPLSLVLMKDGWLEFLMKKHTKANATGAHVKLPVVVDSMPEEEWIREEIFA